MESAVSDRRGDALEELSFPLHVDIPADAFANEGFRTHWARRMRVSGGGDAR